MGSSTDSVSSSASSDAAATASASAGGSAAGDAAGTAGAQAKGGASASTAAGASSATSANGATSGAANKAATADTATFDKAAATAKSQAEAATAKAQYGQFQAQQAASNALQPKATPTAAGATPATATATAVATTPSATAALPTTPTAKSAATATALAKPTAPTPAVASAVKSKPATTSAVAAAPVAQAAATPKAAATAAGAAAGVPAAATKTAAATPAKANPTTLVPLDANTVATINGMATKYNLPSLKALNLSQALDFMDVFKDTNVQKNMSEKDRAMFATSMVDKNNKGLLDTYKNSTNQALLKAGYAPTQIVANAELVNTDMTKLSADVDQQIKAANARGDKAGVLLLNTVKSFAQQGINAGANRPLEKGGAISEFAGYAGKTLSGIMEGIGKGDLASFGVVIEDMGSLYKQSMGKDKLQAAGQGLKTAGDTLVALGKIDKNKYATAGGQMLQAGSNFMSNLAEKDAGKKKGDAAAVGSLIGGVVSATGVLVGNKTLEQQGATLSQAASVFDTGKSVMDLVGKDDPTKAGLQIGEWSLKFGSTLSASLDPKLSADLNKGAELAGTLFKGIDALKNANNTLGLSGKAGAASAVGLTALRQTMGIAGVKVPDSATKLLDQGIAYLSKDVTAGATAEATAKLANMVSDASKGLGLDISAKDIQSKLDTVGKFGGIGTVALQAVQLGFGIAKVAERNDISNITKAALSAEQLSSVVGSASLASEGAGFTAYAGPLGIAAMAINGVGTVMDLAENGLTRANAHELAGITATAATIGGVALAGGAAFSGATMGISLVVGGIVDLVTSLFTQPRDPNAWMHTIEPGKRDAGGWVADPKDKMFSHYTGNKDAFLAVTTPLGRYEYSMHELSGSAAERLKQIEQYKPALQSVYNTDKALADAITQADTQNGQSGKTLAAYHAALAKLGSDGLAPEKSNLDGLNFAKMLDNRYTSVANLLGQTGTQAGAAYNHWSDLLTGKTIGMAGADSILADAIAKNPQMLDISGAMRTHLANTIQPGTVARVAQQVNKTVGDYIINRYNPIIQGVDPQNDKQAFGNVLQDLKLTEGFKYVSTPGVGTAAMFNGPYLAKEPTAKDLIDALSLVPANVKKEASDLNRIGLNGDPNATVRLLGASNRAAYFGGAYEMIVNGVQNSYTYDGKQFKQDSNTLVESLSKFDYKAMKVVEAPDKPAPARRAGDMAKVGVATDKPVVSGASWTITEKAWLAAAKNSEATLRKQGQDVTLLGLSKTHPGKFEVIVNGKQETMSYNIVTGSFQRDIYLNAA